jgi:hypothetical protein
MFFNACGKVGKAGTIEARNQIGVMNEKECWNIVLAEMENSLSKANFQLGLLALVCIKWMGVKSLSRYQMTSLKIGWIVSTNFRC